MKKKEKRVESMFERECEFNRVEFVFRRKKELTGFCFGEKEI